MKTIYLCGPINGRSDNEAMDWRSRVKQLWDGHTLDPMRRDYRGRELEWGVESEIVSGDMQDLANSDGMIVYFDRPSVGTAMEIYHYRTNYPLRPIVVIYVSEEPISPWLNHHISEYTNSLPHAIAMLADYLQEDL
jgi:hypothetical protein